MSASDAESARILLDDDKGSERRAERAYTRIWESIEEQAGEFDVLVMDEFTSTFRYG